MSVGIIGGGIMGISLGYFLSEAGVEVEIFEASPVLGGLAGPIILEDGTAVDRFYHAILTSDTHLHGLFKDLAIEDQYRSDVTRMGFFHQGEIYSMNNVAEFLKFPPLGWIDRFRLGITVLYAQFIKDWHSLEGVSVEDWLIRLSGRTTYENIWRPLLRAKFDGSFDDTPATYIWSRLVRTKSTRGGADQKEESGYLVGGYITMIKAMAERIQANGGQIHLKTPVQEIVIADDRAKGIRVSDQIKPYDAVVSTLQVPIYRRLIPGADAKYQEFLGKTDYLGIVAPLMVLDRPLTGYWTLNITDERFPFTGVIETTTYIDPQDVGGHYLVYLPKYTAPGSPLQQATDEEIRSMWIENLKGMFPDFNEESVVYFLVHRERFVEPLHGLNSNHLIPEIDTPIQDLYLATTAQIYPDLTNGESVSRHARKASEIVLNNLVGEAQKDTQSEPQLSTASD